MDMTRSTFLKTLSLAAAGCVLPGGISLAEPAAPPDMDRHAADMYDKLERTILPLYAERRDGYAAVMRDAIAVNAPVFSTQRMMEQYALRAYFA